MQETMYLCRAIPKGCPTEWAENILYEPDPGNAGEGKRLPDTLFWNAILCCNSVCVIKSAIRKAFEANRETLMTVGLS